MSWSAASVPMASIFSSIWPGIPATPPQTVYPQTGADPGELAVGGGADNRVAGGGLSDRGCVQPSAEFESCCAERVARLPEPGLPFKPAHDALEPVPLPCLERGFITFGVLARPLRTNRQTVALWAKILHRAPRAVLRFDHVPYAEPDVQQRLASYFAEHGN